MDNNKEKASPDAANIERGADKKSATEAIPYPFSKSIRKTEKKQPILALLPLGEEAPITAKELTKALGLSDARYITQQISILRRLGEPICASTNYLKPGYFIAKDPHELERYLKSLLKRKSELQITINSIQRSLNIMAGQHCLWDGDDI